MPSRQVSREPARWGVMLEAHRRSPQGTAESSLAVQVPAKINLFLSVRGLRDDGLHEVVTVLQTVDIRDRIAAGLHGSSAAVNHPAARKLMEVSLDDSGDALVPRGAGNLVVRAANLLLDRFDRPAGSTGSTGQPTPTTRLHLHKRIPVGAGMGGGSADAAATLVLLNELWGLDLDREELCRLGAELGADVPFCVMGGTALGTGTGRTVAQVLCRGVFHWVVCIDPSPLPTGTVYEAWDEVGTPGTDRPNAIFEALAGGDAELLGPALHNDLEAAAFHLRPELRTLRQRLVRAGALGTVMSGSGPTLVALASSAAHAHEIAGRIRGLVPRVEVARSPAGGPELVRDQDTPAVG